jgi:hypothetical protein
MGKWMSFGKLFFFIVFAISFQQLPLYSSNQNTYFLHGLADSGSGTLLNDWLAQTIDPFPVFSALVHTTADVFGENAFYLWYMILLFVFIYSIVGIISYVYEFNKSSVKWISFYVPIIMLYSGFLANLLIKLPALSRFGSIFNPDGLLTMGLAGQYVLGPVFLPSTFGVFIFLSIYFFLHDKHVLSIICLAISATLHSTYLLSAAVMTGTYLVMIFIRDKDIRKVLSIGTFAFVSVMPVLIYIILHFNLTTDSIAIQAENILVDYRFPYHTKVSDWISHSAVFQISIILLAIFLIRRTRLFAILLLPFLAGVILTITQVATSNKSLALLFPWRISVFLVPIASAIIFAQFIALLFQRFNGAISKNSKIIQAVGLVITLLIGYVGLRQTITLFNSPKVGVSSTTNFISSTFQPGNLYLIPPDVDSFRLAARVPVFVDFKSHPYKDVEVVEWFNRITRAHDFYAASGKTACNIFDNLTKDYPITHVVMKNDSSIVDCSMLHEIIKGSDFVVYEVFNRY